MANLLEFLVKWGPRIKKRRIDLIKLTQQLLTHVEKEDNENTRGTLVFASLMIQLSGTTTGVEQWKTVCSAVCGLSSSIFIKVNSVQLTNTAAMVLLDDLRENDTEFRDEYPANKPGKDMIVASTIMTILQGH